MKFTASVVKPVIHFWLIYTKSWYRLSMSLLFLGNRNDHGTLSMCTFLIQYFFPFIHWLSKSDLKIKFLKNFFLSFANKNAGFIKTFNNNHKMYTTPYHLISSLSRLYLSQDFIRNLFLIHKFNAAPSSHFPCWKHWWESVHNRTLHVCNRVKCKTSYSLSPNDGKINNQYIIFERHGIL